MLLEDSMAMALPILGEKVINLVTRHYLLQNFHRKMLLNKYTLTKFYNLQKNLFLASLFLNIQSDKKGYTRIIIKVILSLLDNLFTSKFQNRNLFTGSSKGVL